MIVASTMRRLCGSVATYYRQPVLLEELKAKERMLMIKIMMKQWQNLTEFVIFRCTADGDNISTA